MNNNNFEILHNRLISDETNKLESKITPLSVSSINTWSKSNNKLDENNDDDNEIFNTFEASKLSLFFLIIAGNFLGDTISCTMRHLFHDSILFKHIICQH